MPIETPTAPSDSTVTSPVTAGYTFTSTMRIVSQSGVTLFAAGPFTETTLNNIDFGFPNVRNVSAGITGAHGEYDTTKFMGARAITAVVTLPQGPAADTVHDLIAGLMNPRLRLYLYAQRPGWPSERRIVVRGATFTCPPGTNRQAQIGFAAPLGLLEDAAVTSVTLTPTGSATGGFSFPISFPLTFVGGVVSGAALANVGGTIEASPIIDIYGPCTDPLVRCVDTGEQIRFTMTLNDGDFLRVDMAARTANLNGDPAQPRYQSLDFTTSNWWMLPVGRAVQIVFSPSNPSGGCQAVVSWRSRYL